VNRITYVGHATLLLEIAGTRLLTDPLLSRRVTHLWRTVPLPPAPLERLDAVLISHLHGDHLHLPSLRRLGKQVRLIVPQGTAPFLREHGFRHISEVESGEVVHINGLAIEATPAAHEGPSLPWRPITPALGYIVHGPQPIYFAGDTDLFPEMSAIGQAVDIALLPVWGYGPTLGPGHLDPWRAAEALRLLQPATAIPIHWGTYFPAGLKPMMPHYLHLPPREFVSHARELAPDVRTVILEPGSGLELGPDREAPPILVPPTRRPTPRRRMSAVARS
jgi:L-ascorbate metabolism protein UlaG (beta-lactamase superfamily)